MADPPTVLVVEDEESFVDALVVGLKREGFLVKVARDGVEAVDIFDAVRPDLVLLDVMLPRLSGIDVCREIRTKSRVPIIMVTAKGGEIDTVVGLEVGADDYLTKPFSPRELVARIKAILRRVEPQPTHAVLTLGDVIVNRQTHDVTIAGELVELTAKEFELLAYFLANPGALLSRDQLLDRVWGVEYPGGTRTVDVHVAQLRRKLRRPTLIRTLRGAGYKAVSP
jgi:two-component system, OmpR family, response regulator RegX3